MVEALLIRAALETGSPTDACARFSSARTLAEHHDQYGAAWLVAEVVAELAGAGCAAAWDVAIQFAPNVAKLGYASLSARYIALQDLAQRELAPTPTRTAVRR
jgi:hypothetical protein